MKKYALIPFCLPAFIAGYLYVILMTVCGLAHRWRFDSSTWALKAAWRPWVAKRWRFSTTISQGMIFQPAVYEYDSTPETDTRIERHEDVHVRQVQDNCVIAFFLGLAVYYVTWAAYGDPATRLAGAVWLSAPAWQLTNFLTAWFRGVRIYRDSSHEEYAYALTNTIYLEAVGKSWTQIFAEDREAGVK